MSVEDLVEVYIQFVDKLPLMSLRCAHPGRSHQLVVMTIVVRDVEPPPTPSLPCADRSSRWLQMEVRRSGSTPT